MAAGTFWAIAGDGTRLACETAGEGDPLMLVHGAASDARQWARVEPLLARRFSLVAMNRRGRRGSGPVRAGHSLEVEYGDVAAVATSIPGPVHLLGHSSGARFALHAALGTPNLASLILYEPPAPERLPDAVLASLDRLEDAGDRHGILRLFLLEALGNTEEDLELIQQRPIWPIMLDNALTLPAELRASRHHRFEPSVLAELDVPTALLVGQLSGPEVRTAALQVARSLPDATLLVLPGQGHGAMFSAPELFASEVQRFVDTVATRRRPPED